MCNICFSTETESLLFQRCAIYSLNILKQVRPLNLVYIVKGFFVGAEGDPGAFRL